MKDLSSWRNDVQEFEDNINQTIVGQSKAVRLITISTLARGHVMLEGDVGVGKTTLLKTVAECIGGDFERVEGTIDLMPHDLVYYTYINDAGKPSVNPGPVLKSGEDLSIFFFNEINRARPQVHSLLLRIMAEKSVQAFNQEHKLPHIQVFADRNKVEKDETFELPAAARDRFMMEINIDAPKEEKQMIDLMFNDKYHDVDELTRSVKKSILDYGQLNSLAEEIQSKVKVSETVKSYAYNLSQALRYPDQYGITISDVEMSDLVEAGMSPRGGSFMIRAAKVNAWLNNRMDLYPEDIIAIMEPTVGHRIFLNNIYNYARKAIISDLLTEAKNQVAAP